MNLETKTIEELKVIAYDLMASLEQTQRNLQEVNQMIAKKYEEKPKQTIDENKVIKVSPELISEDGTEKP